MTTPTDEDMKVAREILDSVNCHFGCVITERGIDVLRADIARALASQREASADHLEHGARALICDRRRTDAIDRHMAGVLMKHAAAIRAGKKG